GRWGRSWRMRPARFRTGAAIDKRGDIRARLVDRTTEQLMAQAYIVEALRTAGGRRGGALRDWHPADLGAAVLNALVDRGGIDPAAVEDVIAGCVSQVGEQSFHIGRNM